MLTSDGPRMLEYNVRFGDAVLITIPDRDASGETTVRNVLIDVGNAYGGSGGEDDDAASAGAIARD